MGLISATIVLRNPKEEEFKEMELDVLVDKGALHLCIPEKIAIQLNLKELYKRDVTTADGREHLCPYVGPIEVKFEVSAD